MAKNPVLVDSSYYIGQMRRRINPIPRLTYIAEDRDLVVCGVVRTEVGRGIKDPAFRDALHGYWDVMLNVITDNKLWRDAEEMAWKLDRTGIMLPLQDIVIACCAARVDAVVLTQDKHFAQIPGCKVAFTPEELY
ncbi:MAG: hypothetical protein RL693_1450 [Verrucomicrobiota bacterium]|jgi:predicted nucleic acid-binding protein